MMLVGEGPGGDSMDITGGEVDGESMPVEGGELCGERITMMSGESGGEYIVTLRGEVGGDEGFDKGCNGERGEDGEAVEVAGADKAKGVDATDEEPALPGCE